MSEFGPRNFYFECVCSKKLSDYSYKISYSMIMKNLKCFLGVVGKNIIFWYIVLLGKQFAREFFRHFI